MAELTPKTITLADGAAVELRSPVEADAEALLAYIDAVRRETDGICLSVGDDLMDLDGERQWVRKVREDPRGVQVMALVDGEPIALCALRGNTMVKLQHRVGLGISIRAAWCDRGLGSRLMAELIGWAEAHPELTVVQLSVHSNNPRAIRVYEKLGFVEEGRRRRSIWIHGTYVDEVFMSRWVGGSADGGGLP
ncbi:MAG: GNAT family protein [Planctomycetota bacterium]